MGGKLVPFIARWKVAHHAKLDGFLDLVSAHIVFLWGVIPTNCRVIGFCTILGPLDAQAIWPKAALTPILAAVVVSSLEFWQVLHL